MNINATNITHGSYKNLNATLSFDQPLNLSVNSIGMSEELPTTGGRIYAEFSIAWHSSRTSRTGCFK